MCCNTTSYTIGFRPGVPQILGCAASRDFEVIEGIEAAANENSKELVDLIEMQISPRIPRTDAYLSDLACMDMHRYS